MDPGGQAYPAKQLPLHPALGTPLLPPYIPPEHVLHTPAPTKLNVPWGHSTAVALEEPVGQAYPGVQLPEHAGEVIPPDTL